TAVHDQVRFLDGLVVLRGLCLLAPSEKGSGNCPHDEGDHHQADQRNCGNLEHRIDSFWASGVTSRSSRGLAWRLGPRLPPRLNHARPRGPAYLSSISNNSLASSRNTASSSQ